MERIYEWGLSVGCGPGPSVVHSSVIFTAPQAPMCLPVAAMYTHMRTHTRTQTYTHAHTHARTILYKHGRMRAHIDLSLRRNPVTVQLPLSYVVGQLTSAPASVSSPTSFCLLVSVCSLRDCPPDPTCRHRATNRLSERSTANEFNSDLKNKPLLCRCLQGLASSIAARDHRREKVPAE